MTSGWLIAVVGPSGVGKDSVMLGLHQAVPSMHLVRRVITRAPNLEGEDYEAVSVDDFQLMADAGAFAVHWGAHGLYYGIPKSVHETLATGRDCLVNFSRKALSHGAAEFDRFVVLNLTAQPQTLARRLAERGRETSDEIERRLAEADKPLPGGLDVITVSNDGPLSETVASVLTKLQPVRA